LGLPRSELHSRRARARRLDHDTDCEAYGTCPAVNNPVTCITAGSAMIFQAVNPTHYPIYAKDNLLNSNMEFDYGAFLHLEEGLLAGEYGTADIAFVFTFRDDGIYVFSDSADANKQTIIAVMYAGGSCPSNLLYEAQKPSALLRVGAT
jgi:hypothetical protein